jgi:hypothetical protein
VVLPFAPSTARGGCLLALASEREIDPFVTALR